MFKNNLKITQCSCICSGMSTFDEHEITPESYKQFLCHNQGMLNEKNEKTVAEISMKEFLDFLKISYQVNEAINDKSSSEPVEKTNVDWKKLTTNDVINNLKGFYLHK